MYLYTERYTNYTSFTNYITVMMMTKAIVGLHTNAIWGAYPEHDFTYAAD